MQTKITLIIEVPSAVIPFEVQYPALAERAAALPCLVRFESARVLPCADSSTLKTHRTLDLYFEDFAAATWAASTPEADALFAQLADMDGTFTELISTVTDGQS